MKVVDTIFDKPTIEIRQSRNWWQEKDIDWFIENADFAYTTNSYKGYRVKIHTKTKLNGFDVFEFENDKYGVLINGQSEFNCFTEKTIKEKSVNVKEFLINWLIEYGCGEFINPKESIFSKIAMKLRLTLDKLITIKN